MEDVPYVELVRRLMAEVLGVPDIAENDNFYSIGGDSLAAVRLGMRLSEETGVEVNVAEDVMADPTPCAIARRLADRSPGLSIG